MHTNPGMYVMRAQSLGHMSEFGRCMLAKPAALQSGSHWLQMPTPKKAAGSVSSGASNPDIWKVSTSFKILTISRFKKAFCKDHGYGFYCIFEQETVASLFPFCSVDWNTDIVEGSHV